MPTFKRNEAVDKQGFQGIIPDGTTIPVVLIENSKFGTKLMKLKTGNNTGRIARVFAPVFECVHGNYEGGRVYGNIWCNVELDPTTGEAVVFGSHATYCDLCDATNVHEDDGGYPFAASEADGDALINRMIGKPMWIVVGVKEYTKNDGTEAKTNTIKQVVPMKEEQIKIIADKIAPLMERIRVQQAKRAAKSGGSGLESMMNSPADSSAGMDDLDMPF